MSASREVETTIVVRDRRKPNQYTTDNVIAREWLPILRIGDAFFFYSVYLSMANKETESSWSSLRTLAKYLQCSVDFMIRANRLLEICELVYIETGNPSASNEYFILDPPSLTSELKERICNRLDDISAQESSKNWQSWVKQVRKALSKYKSLPSIWQERREQRENNKIRAVRPGKQNRDKQTGASHKAACVSQTEPICNLSSEVVRHKQGTCETQSKQEQVRKDPIDQDLYMSTRAKCHCLGVASQVFDLLIERYSIAEINHQLDWLPFRHARDPAALLVSAVQKSWSAPEHYDSEQSQSIWREWLQRDIKVMALGWSDSTDETKPGGGAPGKEVLVEMNAVWTLVLEELRLQMTRAAFDTWLTGSEIVRMHDKQVVIRVRDHYAAEWLRGRWIRPIQRTLNGVLGYPTEIRFEV